MIFNFVIISTVFIKGLVGMIDLPREGISDVITKCKRAGIRVMMVTGDYALTAAAIAEKIGIISSCDCDSFEKIKTWKKIDDQDTSFNDYFSKPLLLSGSDLEIMTKDDWRTVTKYQEIVFARTTPEQKLTVVKEFQEDGFIVGVTGDGVNDAPALKKADVGIAMGSGSQVAMEAGQLVLLDNNFSSILVAIKNGRLVFENLKKVVLYLLPGGSFAPLIPVLMAIFLGVPQDLSSFQMIIISLVTDIAPALSLIMEKEEADLLNQPPRSKKDYLVDWKFMLQAYGFLGCLMVIISQLLFFTYMKLYAGLNPNQILFSFGRFPMYNSNSNSTSIIKPDVSIQGYFYRGQTIVFVSIVFMQIFGNLMSTKTRTRSFFQHSRNLWTHFAQLFSSIACLSIVFIPFFQDIFHTRDIPFYFILIALFFSMIIFLADEARKFMVRRKYLGFQNIGW
jgi:sodium/potassium-transporting ATPase subunit alpha